MIPDYYEFQNSAKILSGEFALENIPSELIALNGKNVLLISDKVLENIGTMQKVIDAIDTEDIEIKSVYTDVPSDSSIEVINKIVKVYKENNCNSIVAVGGGSVIDTAKGVRMVLSQEKEDIMELAGCELITYGKHIPFIVIPTTAGTGSEVTLVAVILDNFKNVKKEFISYFLLPDISVLDPRMTLTLPKKITASTAMDAFCHAIEAYTCLQKNPISDVYAISAIEIIRDNLLETVKNGNNKKLRLAMANASLMAGAAFSNSMVGLVHAIGHALGGVCHVPHSDAMAILLPHCMRYNLDKMRDDYSKLLLYVAGEEVFVNTPKEKRAEKVIETIEELLRTLNQEAGLPIKLSQVGVKKEDFEEVAKKALNDGAIIVNPKEAKREDILEILNNAF